MNQKTKDKIAESQKTRLRDIKQEYYFNLKIEHGPDKCWPTEEKAWKFKDGEYRDNRASRKSWAFHNGNIPKGLNVCHHCDNPLCVNPKHLFLGTQHDNLMDASKKGRLAEMGRKVSARKKGVPLPPEQTAKRNATLAKKKALGLTKCSPETKEKIRQAKLAKHFHHSPETIEKIKEKRKHQIISPEVIKKMHEARRAKAALKRLQKRELP